MKQEIKLLNHCGICQYIRQIETDDNTMDFFVCIKHISQTRFNYICKEFLKDKNLENNILYLEQKENIKEQNTCEKCQFVNIKKYEYGDDLRCEKANNKQLNKEFPCICNLFETNQHEKIRCDFFYEK